MKGLGSMIDDPFKKKPLPKYKPPSGQSKLPPRPGMRPPSGQFSANGRGIVQSKAYENQENLSVFGTASLPRHPISGDK